MTPVTTPKPLSPAMRRAMHQLTGTLTGQLRKGQGVALVTAKALARRRLVFLDQPTQGTWTMVLVEPEAQEITDTQLADLDTEEAEILRPVDPKGRYRLLRAAHIARETYGKGPLGVRHGDTGESRVAVLRSMTARRLAWKAGEMTDREYAKHRDLAGEQWKATRNYVTDVWDVCTLDGKTAFCAVGQQYEDAVANAKDRIARFPKKYAVVADRFGLRRLTLGDLRGDVTLADLTAK